MTIFKSRIIKGVIQMKPCWTRKGLGVLIRQQLCTVSETQETPEEIKVEAGVVHLQAKEC